METQTELGKSEVSWEKFEGSGAAGDFLKFKDKEIHVLGFSEVKEVQGKFERKQPDGSVTVEIVPQIGLVVDSVDGHPPKAPLLFATSAKYLIAQIRKYHENKMLYRWYFEMQRSGSDKQTRYTIIPIRERGASPSSLKNDRVEAYAN